VLHPQIEAMPHHWQKMHVEEMLFVAGFDLTVLQPTAYMQNILGAWDGVVRDGVFRFPYPAATRLSLVDLDDVGEAAAVVLTQDGHGGATYELVGTPALSQTEVASALSAALGRGVRAEDEPLAAWEARARASGMGEYERATLAAMFRYYAERGLIGNPNTLRWLLGRAPTDLASFFERERLQSES
jgi:NAD(P)H dehydrogenase (quinone)